jgi:glucokinase
MILAGDVGGTKCNLALFAEENGVLIEVFRERFASKAFANFDLIAKEFASHAAPHLGTNKIVAAGFGIAGPVVDNRVHATNLPWIVDAQVLSQELNVPRIVLLNDLESAGYSIAHLSQNEFLVLNPGKTAAGGTRALIAAGTGLGEAALVWDGARYRTVASEGGHTDFAPRTEEQIALLRALMRRYPQVGYELILSGRGFRTIHEFLDPNVRHPEFDDPDADPAPVITKQALAKTCPVCVATLDMWTAIYGAEAGNLALKVLARGGVYIAGGIAVKIIEKMKDGTFFKNFKDKWGFDALLADVPVSVVLNESAPLLGAAYEALAAVS